MCTFLICSEIEHQFCGNELTKTNFSSQNIIFFYFWENQNAN